MKAVTVWLFSKLLKTKIWWRITILLKYNSFTSLYFVLIRRHTNKDTFRPFLHHFPDFKAKLVHWVFHQQPPPPPILGYFLLSNSSRYTWSQRIYAIVRCTMNCTSLCMSILKSSAGHIYCGPLFRFSLIARFFRQNKTLTIYVPV